MSCVSVPNRIHSCFGNNEHRQRLGLKTERLQVKKVFILVLMKKDQDNEILGWYLIAVPKQIQNQFHIIREYIESSEKFILKESMEIMEDNDVEYESITEYVKTNPFLYRHEEISRIIRNNCFVSAVSLLEAHFKLLVDYLPGKKPTLLLRELSGSELKKPFIYLTKVLGYDLNSIDQNPRLLVKYYGIRNRIIHHLGYIDTKVVDHKSDDTYNFIKGLPDIEINNDSGRVTITDKAFVIEFCNHAEKFLMDCIDHMKNAYSNDKG